MSAYFTCPKGHRWHVSLAETQADEAVACPLCGDTARPAVPDPGAVPTLIDGPSGEAAPPSPHPRVPGYEILGVLGRGGMGVVYKARAVRLNRLVALKVLLDRGHAGPQQLARFQIEAEALASLQHPNVVQIYEVGEYDFCPFLALELVEGGSLAAAMAEGRFPAGDGPAAARLIEALARAMHAVHQRGVVHRDLKPENVLLAACGVADSSATPQAAFVPKITDFGIAKRLDQDSHATRTGTLVGTPHYMAPEQAQVLAQVGPPADIYALGAILYELLTGSPPFDGESALEVLDRVRAEEPAPPSRRRKGVPRDLETIALKCLQKDPQRRYPSAGDLADDLRRYLDGEPIRARPVGAAERLVKWARREPAACALVLLAAFAVIGLVLGAVAYSLRLRQERDRAARGYELALSALDGLLAEVYETDAHTRRVRQRRLGQLERTGSVCDELSRMGKDDPATRRHLARALLLNADILRKLSRHQEALDDATRAIELLEALVETSAADLDSRRYLARAHDVRGWALRVIDRVGEARRDFEAARESLLGVCAESAERSEDLRDLTRVRYNLGILHRETGRTDDAEVELRKALTSGEWLAKTFPDDPDHQLHRALCHLNLATVLRDKKDVAGALRAGDGAIALLEPLRQRYPHRPEVTGALAVALTNRSNALAGQEKRADARRDLKRALALLGPLVQEFPDEPEFSFHLANALNSKGNAECLADRAGARADWEQASELQRRLIKMSPDVPRYRVDLGMTLGNIGWLDLQEYLEVGRPCTLVPLGMAPRLVLQRRRQDLLLGARASLEEGIRHLREALRLNPESRFCKDVLASHQLNLKEVLAQLKPARE
jgi:tetratricopeptide (TPR) repeat protein